MKFRIQQGAVLSNLFLCQKSVYFAVLNGASYKQNSYSKYLLKNFLRKSAKYPENRHFGTCKWYLKRSFCAKRKLPRNGGVLARLPQNRICIGHPIANKFVRSYE